MQRPLRWIKGVAIRGNMQGRSFGSISKLSSAVTTKKNPSLKSSVYGDGLKFIGKTLSANLASGNYNTFNANNGILAKTFPKACQLSWEIH
jgi:NAD-dependent DNA ligase